MNKMTNDIPAGHTKEDIKAREKLIKDFYAGKAKHAESEAVRETSHHEVWGD